MGMGVQLELWSGWVTQAKLFKCAAWYKNPKTQKPNGKKLGTYSPTDAVAQPLEVKGKKSIDRWIK